MSKASGSAWCLEQEKKLVSSKLNTNGLKLFLKKNANFNSHTYLCFSGMFCQFSYQQAILIYFAWKNIDMWAIYYSITFFSSIVKRELVEKNIVSWWVQLSWNRTVLSSTGFVNNTTYHASLTWIMNGIICTLCLLGFFRQNRWAFLN